MLYSVKCTLAFSQVGVFTRSIEIEITVFIKIQKYGIHEMVYLVE